MKKISIFLLILGILLTSTPSAQAFTLSDLQKEIQSLKQEISLLKTKITGQVLSSAFVAYYKGMRSPEVAKFQQALIDQRYLEGGNITGYFGDKTFQAVKNFQMTNGLEANGVLDEITQNLLLNVCKTPIKVLSPNGGEIYESGKEIIVDWETCRRSVPDNAYVRIELQAWGEFPTYFFTHTIDDGHEKITLPTPLTLPGMEYGLGYKISVTYYPKVTPPGGQSFYRDFSDNLFTINAISETSCTQGSWIKKANFGGGLAAGAVGFSIGDKGYIGTGDRDFAAPEKDFWEYNPLTNIWTQKADFSGGERSHATGFSIGDKGYIGTGAFGTIKSDFWEYNPLTNIWTQKADFGGGVRFGAVGFSIGDKGYIGTGRTHITGNSETWKKDFWEYNPSTDNWIQKKDFGGMPRYFAAGFSVGGKGYLGTGYNYVSPSEDYYLNDFWEYNPMTDKWTQKADFGGGVRFGAVGFSIGDKGYIGTGAYYHVPSSYFSDFWEYNPMTDKWTQKADFGGGTRVNAAAFSIGAKGYLGTGHHSIKIPINPNNEDFWEYCVPSED